MTLRKAVLVLPLLVLVGCMDREITTAPDGPLGDLTLQSVTHIVENLDDSGPGSLREAIATAGNGHNITFASALAGGTIELSSELLIDKSLTIVGPQGGITISGQGSTRVFRINSVYEVVLDNLTITDGNTQGSAGSTGGAILNFEGNLTIRNSSITNSWAHSVGGAIEQIRGSLTIVGSTLSGNEADRLAVFQSYGGAIRAVRSNVTLVNSTISGNYAKTGGGGIVNNQGTLTVIHSTIADNGAAFGGGIMNWGDTDNAVTSLVNAIVARNFSGGANAGPDIYNVTVGVSGPSDEKVDLSASHSLIGEQSGHSLTSTSGNIIGADPRFEIDGFGKPKLADNGGPTKTHALLGDSPAIDAADGTACAAEPVNSRDQRGVARPQGACDMGAFELVGAVPPPASPSVDALSITASGTVNKSTGAAVISGTMTCSTPGVVQLKVDLSQEQKQRRLTRTVVGSTTFSVSCNGSTAWATAVTGSNGAFVNGAAHAAAETLNAAPPMSVSQGVTLFWSK